jgi:SagB-type dehydrogenase domain
MDKKVVIVLFLCALAISSIISIDVAIARTDEQIKLPEPEIEGKMSVEEAIKGRRSERGFTDTPLTLKQLSQILWAAQGITGTRGKRAAPSAGATYPIDLYIVVGERGVKGMEAGIYHYIPKGHQIERVLSGDRRIPLARASFRQMFISDAPISIVITGEYERTMARYWERGRRYVHMEAGHVGENIYLQVESLGLGTVAVGAFHDDEITGGRYWRSMDFTLLTPKHGVIVVEINPLTSLKRSLEEKR